MPQEDIFWKRTLNVSVGQDHTPITTHRFKYNIRKITSKETGLKELDGGTTDAYDAYDHRKTYHYDGNHHLTAIIHYLGNHHHSRYREECFVWGNRVGIPVELLSTKYLFDPKRDYVPYIQCFNYDDRGNTIRTALCGQLTGHPSPAIALEPNGWPAPRGHDVDIKTYAYNSRNLLTEEEGSYGRKTTYKYFNKTDNIARKMTLANGKIVLREAFEYDENFALTQKISDDGIRGELEQKRERNGLITHYEREDLGRIKEERLYSQDGVHLSTTRYDYNSLHLIGTTDPRGLETHYVYDCAGRLEKIQTGERVQQHFYDALGRVQEVREFTDPSTYLSTFKKYDLLDRLIEEALKTTDGRLLSLSTYDYDIRGNCIRTQKGDQVTTFVYDTHDQCVEMRDALGHITTYAYNRHFINPYGQRVLQKTTTDPLGFQTIETYDIESRLAEIARKTPHGKLIGRQSVFYDLCGNKSRVIDTLYQEGIEQRQIETRYTYTNHHDVSSLIEAAGTPDEKTTIYHYNHLGQLAIIVKPDQTELHHSYDPFGRLHTILTTPTSIISSMTTKKRSVVGKNTLSKNCGSLLPINIPLQLPSNSTGSHNRKSNSL